MNMEKKWLQGSKNGDKKIVCREKGYDKKVEEIKINKKGVDVGKLMVYHNKSRRK